MPHALITGATGFIGGRLAHKLREQGYEITCLVRRNSNSEALTPYSPRMVVGDVMDLTAVREAVQSVDVIFHLAGQTRALQRSELTRVNETGTRHIAEACAQRISPPLLIHVSSLAAAGPSSRGRPKTEADVPTPVSEYGRSKLAGENILREFVDRIPISIVRPPIVLGPGDRTGLSLFQTIAQTGLHFVPGYAQADMSVVHVDDLVSALHAVATEGRRLSTADTAAGIYFVAADETPTYATLGRWIGRALGRKWTLVIPVPGFAIRGAAAGNELLGRCLGQALYLNWDKAREALAGSWHCSSQRLLEETHFAFSCDLPVRLSQTAQWYIDHGWLKTPRRYSGYPQPPLVEP